MTKLIVMVCAFLGALVLFMIGESAGWFKNSTLITFDSGFELTTALVVAGVVAIISTQKV